MGRGLWVGNNVIRLFLIVYCEGKCSHNEKRPKRHESDMVIQRNNNGE